VLPGTEGGTVRFSLLGLVYLAIGVVVALTNGYNSVAGVSEVLSLIIAVVLWPAVLLGVNLHLPPIAT
jgi:lipopolysaccharide export LptBFGC system permease protein LptF